MGYTAEFNHVTIGVERDLLEGPKRDMLRDFYRSVLDWREESKWTEDGLHLVLKMYRRGQVMNLRLGKPMEWKNALPDHLGIEVKSKKEHDEILAKVHDFKEKRDPAVYVTKPMINIEKSALPHWSVESFYFSYLLPTKFEVLYHEELPVG